MDPFVHLHVASGYSLRYGANLPAALVERAAELEMDTLALTDRDGVYGAVRFAKACMAAGIRPVLGVDLALEPTGLFPSADASGASRRAPARGGAHRDGGGGQMPLPRVTLLACDRAGWASLCRLVSATHLRGERGAPVASSELVAQHASGLLVMLGASSELGWAATRRREDLARAVLRQWRELIDPADLMVEVTSHRAPGLGPGSTSHAARMMAVAHATGVATVLTNAVRYARRDDAPVVDVLDAARRLVPLDSRHLDRANAEGYLKAGKEMAEVADEVCRHAGLGQHEADRLLARTRETADRTALDPRRDLGLGEVHFPEFDLASQPGPAGGLVGESADALLRQRCEGAVGRRYATQQHEAVVRRLDHELSIIQQLGYASYFLTVGDVVDLIRDMGVRAAARGSGAGSLVTYLLGISGVDPIRHRLLMERFLSPRRQALPDIDVDVESARRLEVYEAILDRYGGSRCACVSMMDTYRVRHAVRDVGAALGMPPGEVDAIAKSFPHIRARDARAALRELPELRRSGLGEWRLDLLFNLVERLDGLPRHIAVHPCGVLLSDATLLDRTPVESSYLGYPMSQFDKDDVEDLGLLKLDVLGIRMQSAMAHAVDEVSRVDGVEIDLDDSADVPDDDPATFELIQSTKTLGCFQIESPGQRELIGKFGPESFDDIIIDISLFRPGPVKSDMIVPFLRARQGWSMPTYLHDSLRPVLEQTSGVVVFHEQVIEMIATMTGCGLAEADEARRALGDPEGQQQTRLWFFPRALGCGYPQRVVQQVWEVLEAFASFGFCKAHAAAFAVPTYQSAWLKTHHAAAFLAGVLTHDPGMYPKRLILDDARQCGVAILGLDVNASDDVYRVERLSARGPDERAAASGAGATEAGEGQASYGIRLSLADVKGMSEAEIARIVSARPYASLTDLWHRARPSRPVAERLIRSGALDSLYGIGAAVSVNRPGVTRRDLLLQVSDLDRMSRSADAASRASARRTRSSARAAALPKRDELAAARVPADGGVAPIWADPRGLAAAQARGPTPLEPPADVQLTLDLDDDIVGQEASGLPEMTSDERRDAELEILGLDVSSHAIEPYRPLLAALGVTYSRDLLRPGRRSDLLVAGVKVATQTPPIRSGRRVIFLTLDDSTGPVDATFFDDAQGPYAATLFHAWLLIVRGHLRRTGPRGVSLRATGCWSLPELQDVFDREGLPGVHRFLDADTGVEEPAQVRVTTGSGADSTAGPTAGGMGRRRVLVHASGFRQSPYSDVRPAGESVKHAQPLQGTRKLWHTSPGSPG